MSLESLFNTIQKEALPGIWSKGVAVARDKLVIVDARKLDEWVLRIKMPGKAVSPKVCVWPEEDDAHCDCGDRVEPCIHIVAALVALKNDWAQSQTESDLSPSVKLCYRFSTRQGALAFERVIKYPTSALEPELEIKEHVLTTSLVSWMGGVGSGRITTPAIAATREDFKADQVISQLPLGHGILDRRAIPNLFAALKDLSHVELDGIQISVHPHPVKVQAVLEDSPAGIRLVLHGRSDANGERKFSNGAIIIGGVLKPFQSVSNLVLESATREIKISELPEFVIRSLPILVRETDLEIRSKKIPRLEKIAPRILIETDRVPSSTEELEVMARIVYGSPPIAELINGQLDYSVNTQVSVIPERDEGAEQLLIRELQSDLHLKPRHRVRLSSREAIDFLKRSGRFERQGSAEKAFVLKGGLVPQIRGERSGLSVSFTLPGAVDRNTGRAETARVLAAWRSGESQVPLLDGGWATIPKEWLNRHVDRLETVLALRNPTVLEQIQVAEFCVDTGSEISADLTRLRDQFVEFQGIPDRKLPSDLRAELRSYQKLGVNWLGFLRDSGLGAMLADDMGLGKTLQALCAVQGRTLVIAPTSVLPSWESQIHDFRPALKLGVYYGSSRKMDVNSDITLTSYGVLRQDRALLTATSWDTIILDEAQQIKNPESQIAKIAHELIGKFKIALTGTPIENRLDDLWSQFQFIQPGLLGSRNQGSRFEIEEIKRKIKPLILRRMKKDVTPELPEKTETVLYSVLTEQEQSAYLTILAATQEKVVQELESGGGVMGALEAILRLRQICAHPALIPGLAREGEQEFTLSSKLTLLQETLEESLALGHSVLIFSQWTSFLDLVEKVLNSMKVEFLRLDGTTRNRGEVIENFQREDGPRVMILSLKAGGVGLTLTKADHVIILDPWWNPAVEDQAADRAHRIGQTQPVLVQRFVARDTVEDRILQLQKKKQELARAVLGGESHSGAGKIELTREDLLELLR